MDVAKPTGKRIVVTGGAGFIGSTLIGLLVDDNEVVAFDNLSRNSLESRPWSRHPNLTLQVGDVLDRDAVHKAMAGANIVVHCAAIAGIRTVVKSPVETMRVNMLGSANVLEAASHLASCERVVCFSTSEVFGSTAYLSSESDAAVTGEVGTARWTYAVSKLAEEHLAIAYHRELSLPVTVLRPFNVYGPGQVGEGAVREFIGRARRGEDLVVHGTGSQIRAWCYVDDMVGATLRALTHPAAVGESFNIGNERAVVTVYGLASTVIRVLGSTSTIRFVETDAPDIGIRIPAVDKARKLLDFEAKVDLEDGILRTARAEGQAASSRE